MDGLQRLTTFTRFLGDELKLAGLANGAPSASEHILEGKYFTDLSIGLRERVEDTALTMYILDAKAPERARLDIFERVNSGEPLSRQQMRNAIYNGPGTKWLAAATSGKPFLDATGRTLNRRTMRDREAVNRFCAFKLFGWKAYDSGDLDRFLADCLLKMNEMSESQLLKLREEFDESMRLNYKYFGKHAFRKSLTAHGPDCQRTVINISLFDVCAVGFSHANLPHNSIKERIINLVKDATFESEITSSTNSTQAVHTRFEMMGHIFNAIDASEN